MWTMISTLKREKRVVLFADIYRYFRMCCQEILDAMTKLKNSHETVLLKCVRTV